MVAENKHRHCPGIGTTGTTGTDRGTSATARNVTHDRECKAVPQVPVVPVSKGVPSMFNRFVSSSETIEFPLVLSPVEEQTDASELDDLIEVDFDDVPVCSCGRFCDSQTLDDAWHCSQCDLGVIAHRETTQRWLREVERLERQNI